MDIVCPNCGEHLEIESSLAGRKGQCPFCNECFIIPGGGAAPIEGAGEFGRHGPNEENAPPIESVLCPCCKRQVSGLGVKKRKRITCPHCQTTFANNDGVESDCFEKGKGVMSKNVLAALVVSAAIVIVGATCCYTNYLGNRFGVETAGETVYKIDRHSGEVKVVAPNGECVNAWDRKERIRRSLDDSELEMIKGRGGPESDNTRFSCSLYNGNESISVSSISIRVSFTNRDEKVSRIYRKSVEILPQSTSSVVFSVLYPGWGFQFSGWGVEEARGVVWTEDDEDAR